MDLKNAIPKEDTQEVVAERLNISLRSLQNYLGGKHPPCDVIGRLIDEYQAHEVGICYLSNDCPISRRYIACTEVLPLANSFIRARKEMRDIERLNELIERMAIDDEISDDELGVWTQAEKELKEAVGALIALTAIGHKKSTSSGN